MHNSEIQHIFASQTINNMIQITQTTERYLIGSIFGLTLVTVETITITVAIGGYVISQTEQTIEICPL